MKILRFTLLIMFACTVFATSSSYGQCAMSDVTNPIITCPEAVSDLTCADVLPAGAITVDEFNAIDATSSATDDCGIETIDFVDDLDPATFSFCAVDGPFVVTRTYTIIDTAGLQASCEQLFTFVADDQAPTITCIADTVLYGCTTSIIGAPNFGYSEVSVTITEAEFIAAGGEVDDNCGVASITYEDSQELTSGCLYPLDITRTYTVLDNCDLQSICEQTITILDTVPPVLTCVPDVITTTSDDAVGNCTTVVNDIAVMAMDSCAGEITITYDLSGATTGTGMTNASGIEFLTGETVVTYFAEDCSGNLDSCSFTVTVTDDELPTLMCPVDFTVSTDEGTCEAVVDYTITATDNCSPFVSDSVNVVSGIDSAGVFPIGTTLVEISYSDTSGNVASCMFNVTVEDNEAPVIDCPTDLVIQLPELACDTIIVFDEPLAIDNCMAPLTINRLDMTGLVSGDAFPIGSTDLIFEVVDGNDNRDTCIFNVTVIEYDIPAIANRPSLNISLDENCFGNITPAMVLLGDQLGCLDMCELIILDENGDPRPNQFSGDDVGKQFTYSISCQGLTSQGVVNIEDKFAPQIECVDATISCGELLVFPPVIVEENCFTFETILVNETFTPVDCADPDLQQIVTRQYVAIDAAGNVSDTCTQTLSILKFDIGDVMPPAELDIDLPCGVPFPATADGAPDPEFFGSPRLNGQNLFPEQFLTCNLFVSYTDQVFQTSANETTIARTWEAMSWYCGKDTMAMFFQTFTIADNQGPELTCPGDLSFSQSGADCVAEVILPTIPIMDLCGEVVQVDVQYEGGIILGSNGGQATLPGGISEVTYWATDSNGNTNSCTFNVTVSDITQPITICELNTDVSLTNDGTAIVLASSFDDGSYDACSDVTLQVRRMTPTCDADDALFGDDITFCCEDIGTEQMVVLRATDALGNFNECMVMATVDDKIPPALIAGLPDITISCEFPFSTDDTEQFGSLVFDVEDREDILLTADLVEFNGEALDGLVVGNCLSLTSDEFSFSSINSCGTGTATRILTVTNAAGMTVSDIQVITIVNPSPFTINDITFPADYTIPANTCDVNAALPANLPVGFDVPTFVEDNCDQIGYTYEDQFIDQSEGAQSCFTIIRTFIVADWCQVAPNGTFLTFEGTQTITLVNNIAPVISGDCSNRTQCSFDVECGPAFVELTNSGSDDCTSDEFLEWRYEIDAFSDGSIDIIGNTTDASGIYPVGIHTITWTLDDQCGNTDACTYTFEIQNCKAATPICIDNLTTEINGMDTNGDNVPDTEQVIITSSYFDGGSYHVCGTPVTLSFSPDVADSIRIYGCDDIGEQPIELWVTDINGNQDFCTTSLDVQNNIDLGLCPITLTYTILGDMYTEDDEMIAKTDVVLDGGNTMQTTAEDGHYDFGEMPIGGEYMVSPSKDIDYINGITTLDIILIQKHILGIAPLTSPYKMIAADVNHSESITGQDIIQLRRLILGFSSGFENNTSWRFIDADHVFIAPENPWITSIPEIYEIASLDGDMIIDFRGVKIGDVNNSAQPNELVGEQIDTRSNESLELQVPSERLSAMETKWVPVYARNFNEVTGLQFGMNFTGAKILEVRSGSLSLDESNYVVNTSDNTLSVLWHDATAKTISRDEVLFEVLVQSAVDSELKDVMIISDQVLRSESYDAELQVGKVKLTTRDANLLATTLSINLDLAQNEPNPWMSTTMIAINTPQSSAATLSVMDMSGKVLMRKNITLAKGENEIQITKDELSATGVLYYEIDVKGTRLMKKMVLLK